MVSKNLTPNKTIDNLTRLISICAILVLIANTVLAQTTETIYSDTFSGSNFPSGWNSTTSNKSYYWAVIQGITSIEADPKGSAMNVTKKSGGDINVNIWAFTGGINLTPGVVYTISFSQQNLSIGTVSFNLVFNTRQDYEGANTIATQTWVGKSGWVEQKYTFSVNQAGTYYLGFGVTRMNGDIDLNIDEVRGTSVVTEFYNKNLADLTSLASWGVNKDGSGTQPSNFTDVALRFNIVNYAAGAVCTLPKDWAVSGMHSRIILGNNTGALTLHVSDNKAIAAGVIDVKNYATLTVNSSKCPALDNLGALSTVIFGKSAPAEILEGSVFGTVVFDSAKKNKFSKKVIIKGKLNLKDAMLDLGDNDLELDFGAAVVNASSAKYIMVTGKGRLRQGIRAGAGEAVLPVGNTTYNPVKIKLAAGSQDDIFSVGIIDGVYAAYTNDAPQLTSALTAKTVNKTWLISEDVKGGSDISLTLTWSLPNALTGFDPLKCHIKHYEYGTWDADMPAIADVSTILNGLTSVNTYSVTRSGITSFSPFTVSSEGPAVLPVELLHFWAKASENNTVELNWATAMEKNNAYFSVERSTDGSTFTAIAQVQGVGTTNHRSDYRFTDKNPLAGTSYYRLRQVDADGSFEYLPMRAVTLKGTPSLVLHLYPNPAQGSNVNLRVQGLAGGEEAKLLITDIMGRSVLQQPLQAGMEIQAGGLPAGTYLVRVDGKAGSQSQKLVVR